jgi:copper chaperone CopZ
VNHLTLKVEGMHCDHCAQTIKAVVEREPGVKVAGVSFQGGVARILYDPEATSVDRLVATVGRLGYRVTERSP